MKLLFFHGWGFDASVWDGLRSRLEDWPQAVDDRGYFGHPRPLACKEPCIAVTHSFGAMRLLTEPPPGLEAIVAINGFARFAAGADCPGVAPRVLERMIARFAEAPEEVLARFRHQCGTNQPFEAFDPQSLGADLARLRDGDLRYVSRGLDIPLLSLQAAADRILPEAMREEAFAEARQVDRRNHACAGHLLPQEDPRWCAEAIRDFLEMPR